MNSATVQIVMLRHYRGQQFFIFEIFHPNIVVKSQKKLHYPKRYFGQAAFNTNRDRFLAAFSKLSEKMCSMKKINLRHKLRFKEIKRHQHNWSLNFHLNIAQNSVKFLSRK